MLRNPHVAESSGQAPGWHHTWQARARSRGQHDRRALDHEDNMTGARSIARTAQPNMPRSVQTGASDGLSTLSGGMAPSVQMLAPHGRERETNGTLTCMTAFVAFLVERLHVDLGRVSTAVCMAG
jgi:hypothetical protein